MQAIIVKAIADTQAEWSNLHGDFSSFDKFVRYVYIKTTVGLADAGLWEVRYDEANVACVEMCGQVWGGAR